MIETGGAHFAMQDGRSTLRIKDFVNVWDNIKQCRSGKSVKNCVPLNIKADTFLLMQRGLQKYEETMLKRLGFILAVEHPHKFVIMYCQQLDLWPVAQTAWNYCNDLLRTDLCCRYPAEVLAVSAIVLATRHHGCKLPKQPDICDIFHVERVDVEVRCRPICSRSLDTTEFLLSFPCSMPRKWCVLYTQRRKPPMFQGC